MTLENKRDRITFVAEENSRKEKESTTKSQQKIKKHLDKREAV